MSTAGQTFQQPSQYCSGTQTGKISQMKFLERMIGMFVGPVRVFRTVKDRPSWLAAFLITSLFVVATSFVFMNRVPYEIRREAQLDTSVNAAARIVNDQAQLQKMREEIERRTPRRETLRQKLTVPVIEMIGSLFLAALAASLYLLGAAIAGKPITYRQALTVRVYSDLPPIVIASILLVIVMLLKSPEEINPLGYESLLVSNLGFLVDSKENAALRVMAEYMDVFQIWSLILAALGLTIISGNMKRGPAISIVVVVWLLGLLVKIGAVLLTGGFRL